MLTREVLLREGAAKVAASDADSAPPDPERAQPRLAQAQFGTVPYLGLFLTDLLFIHTAHGDFVELDATVEPGTPTRSSSSVANGRSKSKLVNFDKCRKEFDVLARIKLLQSSTTLYLQFLKGDSEFETFYAQFYTPALLPKQDVTDGRFRRSSAGTSTGAPIRLLNDDECYKLSTQLEKAVVHRSASSSNLPADLKIHNGNNNHPALAPFVNLSAVYSGAFRSSDSAASSPDPVLQTPQRGPPMTLVSIPLDGLDSDGVALQPAFTSTPASHTPRIGPSGTSAAIHRKAKSSDERSVLLRSLSSSFSATSAERSDESTCRNVRVKIDLDHCASSAMPGHEQHAQHTVRATGYNQHGTFNLHSQGRYKTHGSPSATVGKQSQSADQSCAVSFNSLRLVSSKPVHDPRDLRRVAAILNQFQTSTQFVDYKTIQVLNSDRKAHVVRKILAKFNLDTTNDESDYLEFCAANFELVQLLSDGSEVLIGENTNVFYALKSEPGRSDASVLSSPGADYVLALRVK